MLSEKPHGQHDRKGADEGHRNRYCRNHGGAPVLQEKEQDQENQKNGFNQGDIDLLDGCLDEHGGVVGDGVFKTFGKKGTHLLHGGIDLGRYTQSVGAW